MFKKQVAALLLALGMALGIGGVGVVTAAPAAATHTCVDNYEWNAFQIGWGKNRIERLFDTRGWVVWQQGNYAVKKYYACGSYYTIVKIKYWWNGYNWEAYRAVRFH